MLCHVKILQPMKRARRPVTKTSSPEGAAAVDVESSSASLARHVPQRLAALPPWLLITFDIIAEKERCTTRHGMEYVVQHTCVEDIWES